MNQQPSVRLFGHWICPYSVRVSFALGYKGISHEVINVPPTAARPRGFVVPEEFLEHSPLKEIPMVHINGIYKADSIPILEWLEELFPQQPLLPAGREKQAEVRARVQWINTKIFPPMIGVYYGSDPEKIERASEQLLSALTEMTQWLTPENGPWLCGESPSLAEAVLIPLYTRLEGLRQLSFTGDLPAPINDHLAQCSQLPGWAEVNWNQDQTDEYVGRFTKYREKMQSR